MAKSLFFVLPALLLAVPVASAEELQVKNSAAAAGPVISPDTREAWIRHAVDNILEGRSAVPAKRIPSVQSR